ncbi:MAG: hypothetical protein JWP08_844, partial [Bryobacterales bacterium]|nr:hypothetical protein [Bryobacterales bacterium]
LGTQCPRPRQHLAPDLHPVWGPADLHTVWRPAEQTARVRLQAALLE